MTGGYEEWQHLLSAAFLGSNDAPVMFFIDHDVLGRLRPEVEDAAEDLAEAVCSRLRLTAGRALFGPIVTAYRRWQCGPMTEAPPVLPLIAITVLAATSMRTDGVARSTNYYLRLAQALIPGSDARAIDVLRNDLREGAAFLDVVEIWRGLHAWIQGHQDTIGVSTIKDHPHLLRIGYPLSQAMVRQSDQMTLTRLFQALDFTPGSPPDAEVLLGALDIWVAAAQNRLSEAFMRCLGDNDIRPLLASVVGAHAQAWDGRVLTNDGKQRIAIQVGIDLDAWHARWLFPVPPNGPEALTLFVPDSEHEVRLEVVAGLDYYSVQGDLPVGAEALLSGMRLRGRQFAAELPPSPVLFLRPDPQTGAWSSIPGMLPFEDHLVAISSTHLAAFQQLLREAAAEGWRLIPQRGSWLLPGYALFQDVRFTDGNALEIVLSRLPGLRGIGVTPVVIHRARLVRGLPIATTISSTHYLTGGEPDLLLPSGAVPRLATVTLDGRREHLQANGFPLELRRFARGTGRHSVDADGQELTFTTLEEVPDSHPPAGTGTHGWTSDARMSTQSEAFAIVGALVADTSAIPVLARRGRDESWLLHDGGRLERLQEPAPPGFLSSLDIEIRSPFFEISAPASARWLGQRRGTRWRLTEIGSPGQAEYDLDFDILNAWKRARGDSNGERLWQLQLSMAGGVA